MPHHRNSLKYHGSTISDGSIGVSAAYVGNVTQKFNQPVERLMVTDAERFGMDVPTLTVTATPKGRRTQALVEDVDFTTDSTSLTLYKIINLESMKERFVGEFDYVGITKDNVSDYFNCGTFYANVPMPDTTYTITYSPNYFWNPDTEEFYDKEIFITFKTCPVQAAFILEVKRDMVQELASRDAHGMITLVEDGDEYKLTCPGYYHQLAQRRTDTTSELYDYAADKFARYRVVDLFTHCDIAPCIDCYTGMPDDIKSGIVVITGAIYAASAVCNSKTCHYYDVYLEIW